MRRKSLSAKLIQKEDSDKLLNYLVIPRNSAEVTCHISFTTDTNSTSS